MRSALRLCALAALVLALAAPVAHAIEWSRCDDNPDVSVDNVTFQPDPAKAGSDIDIHLLGTSGLSTPVSAGTVKIVVKFRGKFQVLDETDDICDRTTCPLMPGPVDIAAKQKLPPITPPGDYEVHMVASDADGEELICVDLKFNVSPPFASTEDDILTHLFATQAELARAEADDGAAAQSWPRKSGLFKLPAA
ncbi:unnamed protein product [Pedinophyceae sp. YPF-701]|nr:unnamed protein product [Pedinophyceae sp. YPF-701]